MPPNTLNYTHVHTHTHKYVRTLVRVPEGVKETGTKSGICISLRRLCQDLLH